VSGPSLPRGVVWGIRANWKQFVLLTLTVFWVGSVIGIERVTVPLLGSERFHLVQYVVLLSFVASFGFVKAFLNLVAGRAADRWGRRPILVAGWLVALPVPFLLIFGPNWGWVVVANALVGVNQGFAWSMSITSQIDIAGPSARGLAVGINEAGGYAGVTIGGIVGAILAGPYISVYPFELLLAIVVLALLVAFFFVGESRGFAHREATPAGLVDPPASSRSTRTSFGLATWGDRRLLACNQAGLIEKFVDTVAWGLFPLFFVARGVSIPTVGALVGAYTGTWAALQLGTGHLSDRIGRRIPILVGMEVAGAGVAIVALSGSIPVWFLGATTTGVGMALLYPNLVAAVADLASPVERGSVLGVYRFWRDSGYGFGAIVAGLAADAFGLVNALLVVALLMGVAGSAFAGMYRDSRGLRGPPGRA
jgi:MFS family permease